MQVSITFVQIYFSWIFFKANNVGEAVYILKNHFVFNSDRVINLFRIKADFYIAFISILLLVLIDFMEERIQLSARLLNLPLIAKWGLLILFVVLIFTFAVWNETDFLYFQF